MSLTTSHPSPANNHEPRRYALRSRKLATVARFLRDNLEASTWQPVDDPRDARGRRYRWMGLLNLLVLGLCVGAATLRDVERLGRQIIVGRAFGLGGTPSDTLLDRTVRQLVPENLSTVLRAQVRALQRSKRLEVDPNIGISLVAIDGKCIGADRVQKHPCSTPMTPHRRAKGAKRSAKGAKTVSVDGENWSVPDMPAGPDGKVYLTKVLRAVHVGSVVKPVVDQFMLPASRGESPFLQQFVQGLVSWYGRAFVECISLDAGFASQSNLAWLAVMRVHFIVTIKGNAGALCDSLRDKMGGDGDAPPPGGWLVTTTERRSGTIERRMFGRKVEPGDMWGGNYRQIWRVRRTREKNGQLVSAEDRIFITSLPEDRLTAAQSLAAVRAHWGIENDCHWSLDVPWREDTTAWVKVGLARESLSLLRMLAYNLVRVLRHRVLKGPAKGNIPYRELFERIRDALVSPAVRSAAGFT